MVSLERDTLTLTRFEERGVVAVAVCISLMELPCPPPPSVNMELFEPGDLMLARTSIVVSFEFDRRLLVFVRACVARNDAADCRRFVLVPFELSLVILLLLTL